MIEAACRELGLLGARYVSFDVPDSGLAAAIAGARVLGFTGFHVTIPHKVSVVRHVDRLTPAAEAIAAVNCVKLEDGLLVGDNTDGKGFVASVSSACELSALHVLVLGAGGAARAVSVDAALAGAASVTIANRTLEHAEELAELVRATGTEATARVLETPVRVAPEVGLVVNATSVGMTDPAEAIGVDWDGSGAVVADVVIRPSTRFLDVARSAGLETVDGLGMLVEQAVVGLRWWVGLDPDRAVMRQALSAALGFSREAG